MFCTRIIREETIDNDNKRFDLLKWIRSRKSQRLDHILRMGTGRKVRKAVSEILKAPPPVDMMDSKNRLRTQGVS